MKIRFFLHNMKQFTGSGYKNKINGKMHLSQYWPAFLGLRKSIKPV